MPSLAQHASLRRPVRIRILVRGSVQGVGFRPFVYGRAIALGLTGWVNNTSEGVTIEAEGEDDRIAELVHAIRSDPPPNAVVMAIETSELGLAGEAEFTIRESVAAGPRSAHILPDIATCPDCLAELLDPNDRRYRYPFITCTHCGPRFSIIEDVPYDRARTSMRRFPLCADCQAEYDDPTDRRFHAEANACPVCGPRLSLWDATGTTLAEGDDALLAMAAAIGRGRIAAVKGIGGFHLMVDGRDSAAVGRLRDRKRRAEKPFAVMFPSLATLREECQATPPEEAALLGPARPIILLRRIGRTVAKGVAPGNPWLGAMLPYSPLHHLLIRELGYPVVATSGNISDEPIVIDEREALARLAGIADLFLVHDRPIVRPIDDSVVRVIAGGVSVLRCSRGLAPSVLAVSGVREGILAVGGHLKTAIAATTDDGALIGPHVGDLDTVAGREAHGRAIQDIARLQSISIHTVARDLHPDYGSRPAAEALGLPITAVQHHLAHLAACMADNGLAPPVLGVAWDGTGYGPDGTIWGGEFLTITEDGWRRAAHLLPFRLPGGDAASREPRRAALGLLHGAYGDDAFAMTDLAPLAAFAPQELDVLRTMLTRAVNAPLCSSVGRLFDAFAALCGLRQRANYEGQAAAELEWAADAEVATQGYEFPVRAASDGGPLILDWRPALEAALTDLRAGATPGRVSASLHAGLAQAIVAVARRVGLRRVALTGGCFQNLRLSEATIAALRASGFEPHWHHRVPPNDGGIALGQAVWAAWSADTEIAPCA